MWFRKQPLEIQSRRLKRIHLLLFLGSVSPFPYCLSQSSSTSILLDFHRQCACCSYSRKSCIVSTYILAWYRLSTNGILLSSSANEYSCWTLVNAHLLYGSSTVSFDDTSTNHDISSSTIEPFTGCNQTEATTRSRSYSSNFHQCWSINHNWFASNSDFFHGISYGYNISIGSTHYIHYCWSIIRNIMYWNDLHNSTVEKTYSQKRTTKSGCDDRTWITNENYFNCSVTFLNPLRRLTYNLKLPTLLWWYKQKEIAGRLINKCKYQWRFQDLDVKYFLFLWMHIHSQLTAYIRLESFFFLDKTKSGLFIFCILQKTTWKISSLVFLVTIIVKLIMDSTMTPKSKNDRLDWVVLTSYD